MIIYNHREGITPPKKGSKAMYEIINITTKKSEGIFPSFANAEAWVRAHGGFANFRIFPW